MVSSNKFFILLQSRKFWLLVVSLFVLVIASLVFPDFAIDGEAAAGLLVIVATYMVGLVIDPGSPTQKWVNLLKSRKFYAALIGLVVMVISGFGLALPFGLSADQLVEVAMAFGAYIAAVALESKFQAF